MPRKKQAAPPTTSRARKPRKSAGQPRSSRQAREKPQAPRKTPAQTALGARSQPATGQAAARLIDQRIRELRDWRGATLARLRALILQADPEIVEEWKWRGTPVWSRAGIVCTGETYRQVVKLTFARGAALADPRGLFNSSLEGAVRRAIDIREGQALDARAFQALIRAAVAENLRSKSKNSKSPRSATSRPRPAARDAGPVRLLGPVKLLAGGNPQIAKGEGDAPVQAYIAALSPGKQEIVRRLDALVVQHVPAVRKAVKWNSPFYGIEGQGWFLSIHVFTRYVKATFFRGTALRPIPPGGTVKSQEVRWIDLPEHEPLDEGQLAAWIVQAAALPGWLA